MADASHARPVPLRDATVAIVGVGLMGGSLGLALRGTVARRIGVGRGAAGDDAELRAAVEAGAVDEALDAAAAFARADIVVLATPVGALAGWVECAAPALRDGALLTDVGSTKRAVVTAMEGVREGVLAVGGHPMCGRETPGVAHADAALYEGATWVLTPTGASGEGAVAAATLLAQAVGATPLVVDADVHDAVVATTSHLPYVAAQALVRVASQAARDEPLVGQVRGGGFRDATRLAAGDVTMWSDILRANADEVVTAIDAYGEALAQLRAAIVDGDAEGLAHLLGAGCDWRRRP